ncbi:helix-turn-helix domain-containing protein [Rhodocyclus tenuis]|uniref:Transcriptional regulator with XRE-family HTH domain n=1 Tax=Rhodocyclus tenuis TaxID=1066 RepID=A0A840G6P9_RHOTE|nr:helix-turn-helix transcriptional regulator [Rhodocyclus tenuis]MBB4247546.1 transcriptional regulator with XRE-family HTH domain [Rhodocyclus tenuis]
MSSVHDRFPRLVRQLRKARGWSQEQLAEQADLNRSYVGEIERGTAAPSLQTAEKLAQALDLQLSALLAQCERSAQGAAAAHARRGVFDGYSLLSRAESKE